MFTNKLFISLIIAVVTIASVLVWQASTEHVSLVLLPSQLAKSQSQENVHIRMAGRVASDTIDYQLEPTAVLKFNVHDPKVAEPSIPVVYHGLRPDMFATGRDVILEGKWSNGTFLATKLMTQCPSKYEAPDPNKLYKNE